MLRGAILLIQVNGESRTTRAGATVADLLQELEVRPEQVAVELNLQILDRQEFAQRGLNEGDRVEIISFIGGGCGKSFQLSAVSFQLEGSSHLLMADS